MEKRKLTQKEKKRQASFTKLCKEKQKDGYKKIDLTLTANEANVKGVLYAAILAIPFLAIFILLNGRGNELEPIEFLILSISLFFSLVIHEAIHGFFWGLFAKNHWKSIDFGVMWQSLNPYCTCCEPLNKIEYIIGSMMPGIILGIIPSIISIINGNILLLSFGVMEILSAGGDLLVIIVILKHKSNKSTIFLDHPTEIGLVCFEKQKAKGKKKK